MVNAGRVALFLSMLLASGCTGGSQEGTLLKSDFVYVHFDFYVDKEADHPVEKFNGEFVFDKETYVETVSLDRGSNIFSFQLSSTGIEPQILAIDPDVTTKHKLKKNEEQGIAEHVIEAEINTDQNPEYKSPDNLASPKIIYIFRNGFQGQNTLGGKDVRFKTEKLNFVYDFSALNWQELFSGRSPSACLRRQKGTGVDFDLSNHLRWRNGVAILEVYDLEPGDKVRIFWTFRNRPEITCDDAI